MYFTDINVPIKIKKNKRWGHMSLACTIQCRMSEPPKHPLWNGWCFFLFCTDTCDHISMKLIYETEVELEEIKLATSVLCVFASLYHHQCWDNLNKNIIWCTRDADLH